MARPFLCFFPEYYRSGDTLVNFLPFVLVLITIFAGLNTLLMQQQKTVLIEEKAYSGYMNAQRQGCASSNEKTLRENQA